MPILLVIGYFIIGGIAAAIVGDDVVAPGLVFLWPVALLILSSIALCTLFTKLGEIVVDSIRDHVIKPILELFGEARE